MTTAAHDADDAGLFSPMLGDGRPFLTLGALGLLLSGGFALFLAATGHFLPHDVAFLGMTAADLCRLNGCRVVHFMIHDRASFGGALVGLSVLYFWLIHFPLRAGHPWAWWTLLLSAAVGFASFLTYLGFGYLDTWHGLATLLLLPCFVAGLALTFRTLNGPRGIACLFRPPADLWSPALYPRARLLLMFTAAALFVAGLTIAFVGMTVVFVPQDLEYMGVTADRLHALNPRLIPLIAHDRAGFGGAVLNIGLLVMLCAWRGTPSRHLWQALALAGAVGFTTAIGVHPLVGYNNPVHLAPAVAGALGYFAALALMWRRPARLPRGPRGE
jgi:hypothetical protein